MSIINANSFRNAIKNAVESLDANKEYVNSLNVFPVPDGDTGINMFLTIKSAGSHALVEKEDDCSKIAKSWSKGALMGARGNSGVILSQIIRGFSLGLDDAKDIDTKTLALALQSARDIAYKAVMKPTEGTILTVIREIAEFVEQNYRNYDSPVDLLEACIEVGDIALDKTPELLPVLKEAGVIDAGGKGLMFILRGMLDGFLGRVSNYQSEAIQAEFTEVDFDESIKYGYCTEFIVHVSCDIEVDLERFKARLADLGDSIVCVQTDDIIKVHVHTNHPGLAFELGLEHGYLTGIKADNMRLQNAEVRAKHDQEIEEKAEVDEHKEHGFISVVAGEGLSDLFKDLGASKIVLGGQTMNPSVEDLLSAIDKTNADNIFILPNNSNIILTAENAADLTDKNVIVIPTRTIPQGIQAMINFDENSDLNTITETMTNSLGSVISGSITYAVRDTVVDGKEIKTGDFMAIIDGKIVANGVDRYSVLEEALKNTVDSDCSIITLYAGEEISDDIMEEDADRLEEEFSDLDIEYLRGDQPVYYYLFSIE
ncbi:MAG: DAK2 domain-containing protein [Ezakiella sp.]|nr:DAK2 domain-containing protein [Ezakiella sp.]MDY3946542.1 DAK2 domain-containing protein [Ezakiella sp.]